MSAAERPDLAGCGASIANEARQHVDLAAERLMEAWQDVLEGVYLVGGIARPKEDSPLSLLFSTPFGAVCFVEGGSSDMWLTKWNPGCSCGEARRLLSTDDLDAIVDSCIEALSTAPAYDRKRKHLN